MPPRNMNAAIMYSMAGELKLAMLALWVENPPVEIVVIAWLILSNTPIPPSHRHRAHAMVKEI